ncbi:hypothetical protein [Acinetobacter rongchengensis]|uniref:Uncharacterized protein n=1 Tax=Acinetobacter rongchengensis TaxID=2419601 RepID=A0A3A8FAH9_9GAMM|nr:hypothetical protein [Acinetobacter rongchengensis]RKG40020.1 hypothetical protein D7V20_02805 [Acinetobacter rongchengensis]
MKIALIALVILSIVFLFGLVFMSFKLLRKAQKEELQQRRELRKTGDYQIHPQVAEEWKRLEQMKKNFEDQNNK